MLKKIKTISAIVASVALISSCSITTPIGATGNPIGSKVGTATGTCYLNVICLGADASIQSAAKAGGITKISTVDMKRGDVLGIIQTYQTIVTGE
jgi:hypothetical protein